MRAVNADLLAPVPQVFSIELDVGDPLDLRGRSRAKRIWDTSMPFPERRDNS
jgi:hypothetical protein